MSQSHSIDNQDLHFYQESVGVQAESAADSENGGGFKSESLEDFKHAPPKPEGDPWEILLKPLMENEQLQCNAWKDEVQNLLIFAGLFSAVVTTFIVESYKSLQPDPNDAIINLLSHIATRLDGPLNSTSNVVSLSTQSFSPTSSSTRINAFWSLSLVLSLTTVLVGIIALQWLREHQSYSPNLTSRDKYALCLMRADGLKRWHVESIFTSLPLLLQCALILFFGGIIDFLHAIGSWPVVLPVIIIAGLTLFFLVATTLLPWMQVSLLYFVSFKEDTPYRTPPSQCPFKSPQSRAIRNISLAILRIRRGLRARYDIGGYFPRFFRPWVNPSTDGTKSQFTRYLYRASWQASWKDFDFAWLAIRDGYMRSFLKRSSWSQHVGQMGVVPFYDIVHGLLLQRLYAPLFSSTYHCFADISDQALRHQGGTRKLARIDNVCRQSAYLHDLVGSRDGGTSSSSNYLIHRSPDSVTPYGINFITLSKTVADIIHHQNIEAFAYTSTGKVYLVMMLRLHLLRCYFQTQDIAFLSDGQSKIPHCLQLNSYAIHQLLTQDNQHGIQEFVGMNLFITWDGSYTYQTNFQDVSREMAILTRIILQQTDNNLPHSSVAFHSSIQFRIVYLYMETSGFCALKVLELAGHVPDSVKEYHSIFNFIKEHLMNEMTLWHKQNSSFPSLFFYTASLFAYSVVDGLPATGSTSWINTNIPFRSMCSAIDIYRKRSIDLGMTNPVFEEALQENHQSSFSTTWWDKLSYYKLGESTSSNLSSLLRNAQGNNGVTT